MGGGDGGGLNPLVIVAVITALGVIISWILARSKRASGRNPPEPAPPPEEPQPPPTEGPQAEAGPLGAAAPPSEEPDGPRPSGSILLAVPSRFVDEFRAQVVGLSVALNGTVIRTGDRLQYAGIPLVVAAAGPGHSIVTLDTIVRVRQVTGEIGATCPRCETEATLPALACSRCSGPIVIELVDSGSTLSTALAINQSAPENQEGALPAVSPDPTEPGTSTRTLTRDHWLALGGAVAIGLSIWLPWISTSRSYNGFEIRLFNVLLDDHGEGGPAVAFILLLVASIGVVAAAAAARSYRHPNDDRSGATEKSVLTVLKLVGTLTALFCLWFTRWIWSTAGGINGLFDVMGPAPIIAFVGAVASIVSTRRSSALRSGT